MLSLLILLVIIYINVSLFVYAEKRGEVLIIEVRRPWYRRRAVMVVDTKGNVMAYKGPYEDPRGIVRAVFHPHMAQRAVAHATNIPWFLVNVRRF